MKIFAWEFSLEYDGLWTCRTVTGTYSLILYEGLHNLSLKISEMANESLLASGSFGNVVTG